MSSICSDNKNVREFIHWMFFFFFQKKYDLYACCPSSPEYGHLRYVLVITIMKNQKKKTTKIRITEENLKRNELRT